MVTWNRREYFERTIRHLLHDSSNFKLFVWDNGSIDGVRDIVQDTKDERIVRKHFSPKNVGQFSPWHWFLQECGSKIAGKLDDDILGEAGWMTRFASLIEEHAELGVLGAWVYLRSEWDEALAKHKIIRIRNQRIFQNGWVPGGIFLGRTELLRKHSSHDSGQWGIPLRQMDITKTGTIVGYPLPMSFAEHLDDPRSPFCRMNRPGGWDEFAAYSARMRKFSGPEEYGRWIAADARQLLETSVSEQIRHAFPTRAGRLKAKLKHNIEKLRRLSR
jgi:glycosyltransferase involved in cell wall biosynthesis